MESDRDRVRRYACLGALTFLIGVSECARGAADFFRSVDRSPPTIDGIVGWGEWDISRRIELGVGFVSLRSDAQRLYVLLDLQEFMDENPADFFWLTFDVNRDRRITPRVDINYEFHPPTGEIRPHYYLGPGEMSAPLSRTRSSVARRFDSFLADGSRRVDLNPFEISESRHRVYEVAIDLEEIGAKPGDTIRFGIRVASPGSGAAKDVPGDFPNNFESLLEAKLDIPYEKIPIGDAKATIGLQADAIEITQAIQTRKNTLPLVQGKKTVARVYVDVKGVTAPQPITVFLYAKKDGVDLAGSPLAKGFSVWPWVDRERVDDVPFFLLPAWWTEGSVTFTAKVRDSFGKEVSSAPVALEFKKRKTPLVWIIPVNTGTASSPVLPSDAEIADEESDMRAVYPVPDITFLRKSWQALGTVDPILVTTNSGQGALDRVKDWHGKVVAGWLLGFLASGKSPFDLPDQVYGATSLGGGLSDPAWTGGLGYAAIGHRGSAGDATMHHEINHNLDQDKSGTWGRHAQHDCGAKGPDPNWPYANDDIQEVGFDTRSPVSAGGGRLTVVPHDYPDFMSYCTAGTPSNILLPATWISPYRWQHLFDALAPISPGKGLPRSKDEVGIMYHISGRIRDDGTGELHPIFALPGILDEPRARGDHAIEIRDAAGAALRTILLPVSFVNPDGLPVSTYSFHIQTPEVMGVASVRLLRGGQVLDAVVVSPNPPQVAVVSPNGGERWSGVHPVIWEASDADGDRLWFDVFYTPDDGWRWFPIAIGVEGAFEVDASSLFGGTRARIRVVASDGFHTVHDDSDWMFSVASKPPQILITDPPMSKGIPGNGPVLFRAEASDIEDGDLPDERILWSSGGMVFGIGREVEAVLPAGVRDLKLIAIGQDGEAGEVEGSAWIRTGGASLYLNCGGTEEIVDREGRVWQPDASFLAPRQPETVTRLAAGVVSTERLTDRVIPNEVLLAERWRDGDIAYQIPVASGRYRVVLYVSENYPQAVSPALGGTGCTRCARIFDIEVEGQAARNYNPADAALPPAGDGRGATFVATEVVFELPVTDGILDVAIVDKGAGNPPENAVIQAMAIARLDEEYALRISSATACPGAEVRTDLVLTNPRPAQGFSIGLGFDPDLLTLNRLTLEGTRAAGADYFQPSVDPVAGWCTAGVVMSTKATDRPIPAGVDQPVLGLVFTVSCDAREAIPLRFEDGHVPSILAVANELTVEGAEISPRLEDGAIAVAPLAPPEVTATCRGDEVLLCWTLGGCIDREARVAIFRNGVEIAEVSPAIGCFTDRPCSDPRADPETRYAVRVIDRCGRVASASVAASCCRGRFRRGDCNDDGGVNVSDAIMIANLLFAQGTRPPGCLLACDVNGSDAIGITDAVYLLNYLFQGGPEPAAPWPRCGPVPENPAYPCETFAHCPQ